MDKKWNCSSPQSSVNVPHGSRRLTFSLTLNLLGGRKKCGFEWVCSSYFDGYWKLMEGVFDSGSGKGVWRVAIALLPWVCAGATYDSLFALCLLGDGKKKRLWGELMWVPPTPPAHLSSVGCLLTNERSVAVKTLRGGKLHCGVKIDDVCVAPSLQAHTCPRPGRVECTRQ